MNRISAQNWYASKNTAVSLHERKKRAKFIEDLEAILAEKTKQVKGYTFPTSVIQAAEDVVDPPTEEDTEETEISALELNQLFQTSLEQDKQVMSAGQAEEAK